MLMPVMLWPSPSKLPVNGCFWEPIGVQFSTLVRSMLAVSLPLLARPEILISIGDHAFNDLMPISAIGGQTLWIDPYPGIHEPEYTWCVHTLAELAAFLDTIS